jgi:hypothetical protein
MLRREPGISEEADVIKENCDNRGDNKKYRGAWQM